MLRPSMVNSRGQHGIRCFGQEALQTEAARHIRAASDGEPPSVMRPSPPPDGLKSP